MNRLSGALSSTAVLLARNVGPHGASFDVKYANRVPFRTEVTMLEHIFRPRIYADMRVQFKSPIFESGVRAIPRDLGELPRNYALKVLFFHQPSTVLELWGICKARDDVPFDSARHLRAVLRIARMQNWVYTEKNLSNGRFYFYIHRQRMGEVQEMIREDEAVKKKEAALDVKRQEAKEQKENEERKEAQTIAIQHCEEMLRDNIKRIKQYDPEYVKSLPYVTPSGTVDFSKIQPSS